MLLNFDYDGVIVDSFDQLLSLCVRAQQELGTGRTPTARDFQTLEDLSCKGLCRLIGIPDEKVSQYGDILFSMQAEDWSVDIFSEMIPTLRQLAETNTLAIITSSGSKIVADTLAQSDLAGVFSAILGGDMGLNKIERIERNMRDFDIPRERTFMIGDAISDIRQGKAAGVKTIATTWGYQPRNLLENESPDFIADNPQDLLEIVSVNS